MSSLSTERILNSFPMFGRTGWSALEYAGSLSEMRNTKTSETSGSLERTSTTSTHDENSTPPTTAGTQPTGCDLSPPILFQNESRFRKRARGTFLNHTPRDYEISGSKPVDGHPPLLKSREIYSCPGAFGRVISVNEDDVFARSYGHSLSAEIYKTALRISVLPVAPIEPESKEVPLALSKEEGYHSSVAPLQRSTSVPVARARRSEPRATLSCGYTRCEVGARSPKSPIHHFQARRYLRREKSAKAAAAPSKRSASRYALFEPLVARHRRKHSHEAAGGLPQIETEQFEDLGIFGEIQEYLDSQAGDPFLTLETCLRVCSPDPQDIVLPELPESALFGSVKGQLTTYSTRELETREPVPAIPFRSPKRLLVPSETPPHATSSLAASNDYGTLGQGHYVPSRPIHLHTDDIQVPRLRGPKRLDVGEAGQVGSPRVGRQAPPILSHDALTANENLGLNDLSYYLKHTGPSPTESQAPALHRQRKRIRLFKAKNRKKETPAHAESSSPQNISKQAPVLPACAREMKTSGGVRHLRIVVPSTDNEYDMQLESVPALPVKDQQRQLQRHASSNGFDEETSCPARGLAVQRTLYPSPSEPALRSYSMPRTARQEQMRASKSQDGQRVQRRPPPHSYHGRMTKEKFDNNGFGGGGAVCTSETIHDTIMDGYCYDEGFEEEDPASRMERLKERVVLLQRQNMRLMASLARIVGMDQNQDELDCETVLRASSRFEIPCQF
jgi:hypothetical protein